MRLKIWFLILAAVLVFSVSADEKAALEAFSAGRELENQRKFLSAADSYLESQVQADEPIQKVHALSLPESTEIRRGIRLSPAARTGTRHPDQLL